MQCQKLKSSLDNSCDSFVAGKKFIDFVRLLLSCSFIPSCLSKWIQAESGSCHVSALNNPSIFFIFIISKTFSTLLCNDLMLRKPKKIGNSFFTISWRYAERREEESDWRCFGRLSWTFRPALFPWYCHLFRFLAIPRLSICRFVLWLKTTSWLLKRFNLSTLTK